MYGILSDLVINEIKSVTDIYSEKNAHSQRINRELWAIVLKYEGETKYVCKGKKYISNINNPVILPKGCSYYWKCVKPGHFYSLDFISELNCNEILSNDYSSIGDIASMLGFKSIYDFSRAFKVHTGSSPSEYAKLLNQCK